MALQRQSVHGVEPDAVPPIVYDVLRSPGRPLDEETRAFFEPRFGHDFSRVRLHTDAKAAQSALSVNALAYTVGPHVVFGAARHEPSTLSGRELMAHELTHVVQQGVLGTSATPNLTISPNGSAAEHEAEIIAGRIIDGQLDRSASPTGATPASGLQRQAMPNTPTPAAAPASSCNTPTNPEHSGPADNPTLGQETEGQLKALIASDCLLPFPTGMCEDGISAQQAYDEASAKSESLLAGAPLDKCGPPAPGGDQWPGSARLPGRIDGPDDAFRHCFASCVLASRTSVAWSERVGTDHENSQDPTSLAGQMDLHNNFMGRSFSKLHDESGCEGSCLEGVRNGQLRTIQVRAPNCDDEICKGPSNQPWPFPSVTPPAPAPPAPMPTATYVVVPGDYLVKIAQQFYGDGSQWRKIYGANVDVIGSDPDLIYPGEVLVIPP